MCSGQWTAGRVESVEMWMGELREVNEMTETTLTSTETVVLRYREVVFKDCSVSL